MTAPFPTPGVDAPNGFARPVLSGPPRLDVRGLSKAFGGVPAIDNVSLTVRGHEFVAVLGPSGAGKTTLFRCVAGLLAPDAGDIRIGGRDISEMRGAERRRIAVVFQQFNLVNRLTAMENVLAGRLGYVAAWRGWTRRFTRADRLLALSCLDRVGLLAQAMQRADTLSGGQQQRVAIARALAQRPDLIVADEPVASLDPQTSVSVLELLRGIAHTEGVGIVCSLHQVHFARAYADRIVGLMGGKVVVDAPAAAFDEAAFANLYGPQADAGSSEGRRD
ncbi:MULTISPECIES: phosphonate ABC transporter ATP-binding protein [Rhodomicrobium]|uniref:phosphonate ABC transporter ATP-binding protein n=1 Tax=Rhodomicrobium TaxID=1068 RepID=UPI000B4BEE73|nr:MULTISPECIES: phosphonate ABC transporter ATP-binding protein [Rhodomicrobium]